MSKKIVCVSDISAVNSNLIVGWKLFALKRNSSILSLFVSHIVQMHRTTVFSQMLLINRCFKLSGVLLKLCRLILAIGCVKNVLSDRLFLGKLNILEFIRAV